ncbi:MAG TPA: heme biosynthesis protein HemY, partial [archaeon]|nr:heme biosynthesis protein HemY [archaeon]
PQLLASLGKLCAQAELWGKARSSLEASLTFEESRAAHLELARLAERLGQGEEAQRHYRRAAELP